MSLTRNAIEQWAEAYIEVQQQATIQPDHPLWWSIEQFMDLHERHAAEDAWAAILDILARKPAANVVGMLAAGPLEELIDQWGPEFIERIELESRQNPAFRHLLNGIWQSSTPDIWARIEQSRDAH